ncbi:biopolymer transporter ExbD [Lentisphaerota bacterium WC36G]|nr:biopolymer transporter ExbD [Lentisphaerae bacterium WC36]
MRKARRRTQLNSIDEINMTPLIDLTFLLLIIFMITTPLLEYSIDVSTPQFTGKKLPEEKMFNISITKDGRYLYNETTVSLNQLNNELAALFAANPQAKIMVRGDHQRQYGEVIGLLKVAKNNGFKTINLVTQAEDK